MKNELTEDNILTVVQFTSKRKRAAIAVRYPQNAGQDNEVRVFCKGAPDMLFDLTNSVITGNGTVEDMYAQTACPEKLLKAGESAGSFITHREMFERTVKTFANEAYRTLLITYRDMSMAEYQQIKA